MQHLAQGSSADCAGSPYYFQAAPYAPYANPPYGPAPMYPPYAYHAAPHMLSAGPFLVHPQHMGLPSGMMAMPPHAGHIEGHWASTPGMHVWAPIHKARSASPEFHLLATLYWPARYITGYCQWLYNLEVHLSIVQAKCSKLPLTPQLVWCSTGAIRARRAAAGWSANLQHMAQLKHACPASRHSVLLLLPVASTLHCPWQLLLRL